MSMPPTRTRRSNHGPSNGVPHSVTQGDFSNPCVSIASQNGVPGFDSGLQEGTQFTLNVTNDQIRM